MPRIALGKHHARFDLSRDPPRLLRPLFWPALASRRMREFFYDLPTSRTRMAFVGLFFWRLFEEITNGNTRRIVRAVNPDADLEIYMETFTGREAWVGAFEQWVESFEGFHLRVQEVINPPGSRVLVVHRVSGEWRRSGARTEQLMTFALEIERGMAVRAKFYEDRDTALAAAGLAANPERRPVDA